MGEKSQAVFGIFDGHSGCKASQFWRDVIHTKLQEKYSDLKTDVSKTIQNGKIVLFNFLVLQETDSEFLNLAEKYQLSGGSTCVLGVVMNGKLTLASIGDSTAFLVKNSNVIELTSEHNYSRLDEFKRVTDHYS